MQPHQTEIPAMVASQMLDILKHLTMPLSGAHASMPHQLLILARLGHNVFCAGIAFIVSNATLATIELQRNHVT